MKFDTKDIKERARKDFEKTWMDTAKILPEKSAKDYSGGIGTVHPLHALIQDVRKMFISIGFSEVENPVYVPEEEVYWQYGPEAPVILDRCYYLAGLPRPDIGLGKTEIEKIRAINHGIEIEKVKELLRGYREGLIEGDNLLEDMVNGLGISTADAAKILGIFPAFRELKAVAEKTTLRSHMTAAWFPTLKALADKEEMPLRLFSIGLRFRREQKVDATHLRAHYGASCVIMDPDISLDAGKKVSEKMIERLGFKDINYTIKKATANYYAPGMEYEIFSGNVEVADCGMYSPVALSNYGIEYPVFNIGFGLERILMIRKKQSDVRELLYPQFYKALSFTDKELAGQISIERIPRTEEGKTLAGSIADVARKNASASSPCKYAAYEGKFMDRDIIVYVVEKEDGTKLLGPAALNNIYAYQGGIYGLPDDMSALKKDLSEVKEKGLRASFDFLDALSSRFASDIENAITEGKTSGTFAAKMAKTPGEINISVTDAARRFIGGKNQPIALKGPVFMSVEFMLK
jgi:O-phosphoseryl-tRNA synthetase